MTMSRQAEPSGDHARQHVAPLAGTETPWRPRARNGVLLTAVLTAIGSALAVRVTTAFAANPSPPFKQCPAVALDTSCAILIVIQPDGSLTILSDPTQKPFDGSEDTLVGVQNNSAITVPSISIGSSTQAAVSFEAPAGEDGLCHYAFPGNGYCTATPKPPTGYEGPDTRFSAISANKRDGTVSFTDLGGGLAAGASTYFSLETKVDATKLGTGATTSIAFTITSARASDFADSATVAATLTSGGQPVANAQLTFTLAPGGGSVNCSGTTNRAGVAMCSLTPSQPAGSYQLVASYAGSSVPFLAPVRTTVPFAVTAEQDAVVYTGPASATAGKPLALSGVLTTDDPSTGTSVSGRTIMLALGTGLGAQTCSGVTNSAGSASCTVVVSPLASAGDYPASVAFASDGSYQAAAAAGTVRITAVVTTPDVGAWQGTPWVAAGLLILTGFGLAAAARRRRWPTVRARGGETRRW